MAHGLDTQHPVHQAMQHMATRLGELSAGSMRIDIYPNAQLGGEREILELLQIGSLALTKVSSGPMESFVPSFKVFSIPYVFRDYAHLWRVLQGEVGRELLQAGDAVRLHGLGYYDAGSRSFYTTAAPVHSPADLAGLKIRVQNSITSVEMVRALGGAATPIPWAEIYTALQQGVVDGAENNPPSYYLSKHYEVAPYFSLDEHAFVPDILLVSLPVWEGLSPQQRQWLQQAADDSVQLQRQLWRESTAHALAQLRAAGVTIIEPDKRAFRAAVAPMHASFRGTATGALLQRIAAVE
nr:TRAP transporter substrate-binding protein [Haliea sp. SAOS-164]